MKKSLKNCKKSLMKLGMGATEEIWAKKEAEQQQDEKEE